MVYDLGLQLVLVATSSPIKGWSISILSIRFENILVDNENKVWLIDFGEAIADSKEDQIEDDIFGMNFLLEEMNISPSTSQNQEMLESSNDAQDSNIQSAQKPQQQ